MRDRKWEKGVEEIDLIRFFFFKLFGKRKERSEGVGNK